MTESLVKIFLGVLGGVVTSVMAGVKLADSANKRNTILQEKLMEQKNEDLKSAKVEKENLGYRVEELRETVQQYYNEIGRLTDELEEARIKIRKLEREKGA